MYNSRIIFDNLLATYKKYVNNSSMLFTVSNLNIDNTLYVLDILSSKYNFKHINLKDFTKALKQMIKEYKLSKYFNVNYNDKIKIMKQLIIY